MLKIFRVVIATTLRCNLDCKLCFPKAPLLKHPWHPDTAYLKAELDRIFSIIDSCGRLDLSGGEPLLRTDLHEVLSHALQYISRMDDGIRIITNGTIVPNSKIIDACKAYHGRIEFLVDNYGTDVSTKIKEISHVLDEADIRYSIRNNDPNSPHCGGWVDLGIERGKRNSPEKAQELFQHCICNDELRYAGAIEAGRQYICKMSKLVTLAGWEPDRPEEYVDLMDMSKSAEDLRAELNELYNRPCIAACQYCNGFFHDSPRFAPGVQMTPEEKEAAKKF